MGRSRQTYKNPLLPDLSEGHGVVSDLYKDYDVTPCFGGVMGYVPVFLLPRSVSPYT